MKETAQTPDMHVWCRKLADQKVVEITREAVARELDPFLCVVVLQTYNNGLAVRAARDTKALPDTEKMNEFLEKVKALVVEYAASSPGLQIVPGTEP